MELTKKEALEKIEELKEYVENLDKPKKFALAKFSDRAHVLLTNSNDDKLIVTWRKEIDVNDEEYILDNNFGQVWINGDVCPFEITDKHGNMLLESNKQAYIRFLNKESM